MNRLLSLAEEFETETESKPEELIQRAHSKASQFIARELGDRLSPVERTNSGYAFQITTATPSSFHLFRKLLSSFPAPLKKSENHDVEKAGVILHYQSYSVSLKIIRNKITARLSIF